MATRRRKVKSRKILVLDFLIRIGAVFLAYAFKAIASGAIVGVEISKALLMAGIMGVATVFENFARGLIGDARLSKAEVDAAFNEANSRIDSFEGK